MDAIAANVQSIREQLPSSTQMMAVVKANAYGHGALEVAEIALKSGAIWLGVAILEEAIYLRKNGVTAPILVLGYCPPEYAHIAADYRISLTVFHKNWLIQAKESLKKVLPIHLKCDTGMGRIGVIDEEELVDVLEEIERSDCFDFEGIFTHFSKADTKDNRYYLKQLATFNQFLDIVKQKPKWIHASNSAATLLYQDGLFNLTRSGITIYGLTPSTEIKDDLPISLKPAFSLHSKLVHVKNVKKGTKIGYGCTYTVECDDEWIGTIPIGYADGWIRALQGQTVLINGMRAPIVGRICMDQCMVKLPSYFPVGTEVTLIGKQQNDEITVDEVADKLQTINYEVICMISNRVPRVYKKGNQVVKVVNHQY
ncbi:alanine racemase [Perspicuibacillus lycopersici]